MFEETKLEQKPHFRLGFLKYEGGGPNVLVEIWVPMTKNPQTGLLSVIIDHMRALFWTGQLVGGQDLKEIARCPNHCWSIFQVKKDPCALLFCSQSLI